MSMLLFGLPLLLWLTNSSAAVYVDSDIGWNKIVWHSCLVPSNNTKALRTFDTDLRTCLGSCARLTNCTVASYWRVGHRCEILDTESEIRAIVKNGSCMYVRRENIKINPTTSATCDTCTFGTTCDVATNSCVIQACSDLVVPFGNVYGNMRQIGARRKLECPELGTSSNPVCQPNGTWSDVLSCAKASTCPSFNRTVQVSSGSLRLAIMTEEVFNHSEALGCCRGVGDLVRIDSQEKMTAVRQLLEQFSETVIGHWVQGNNISGHFTFHNGDPMTVSDNMWKIDKQRGGCVILDDDRLINDIVCKDLGGYICEYTDVPKLSGMMYG